MAKTYQTAAVLFDVLKAVNQTELDPQVTFVFSRKHKKQLLVFLSDGIYVSSAYINRLRGKGKKLKLKRRF